MKSRRRAVPGQDELRVGDRSVRRAVIVVSASAVLAAGVMAAPQVIAALLHGGTPPGHPVPVRPAATSVTSEPDDDVGGPVTPHDYHVPETRPGYGPTPDSGDDSPRDRAERPADGGRHSEPGDHRGRHTEPGDDSGGSGPSSDDSNGSGGGGDDHSGHGSDH
jgi:hypothetical protein